MTQTAPETSLTLPEMICFALYSANHAMQRTYGPLLEPHGLTYPQYLVLATLWAEPEQSVGSIGKALQLDSNTLTPLLKRMEARHLLVRRRSLEDERQVLVRLTDQGRALKSVLSGVPNCILDASGLELDDLALLRDWIKVLRDGLQEKKAA